MHVCMERCCMCNLLPGLQRCCSAVLTTGGLGDFEAIAAGLQKFRIDTRDGKQLPQPSSAANDAHLEAEGRELDLSKFPAPRWVYEKCLMVKSTARSPPWVWHWQCQQGSYSPGLLLRQNNLMTLQETACGLLRPTVPRTAVRRVLQHMLQMHVGCAIAAAQVPHPAGRHMEG